MRHTLTLTLFGPDRPGLVEQVATILGAHEANWCGSSMSQLGGKFAGILVTDVEAEREPALIRSLEALQASGLTVRAESNHAPEPLGGGVPAHLELVGQDQPGIINRLSQTLVALGISYDQLNTRVESGAMSAEPLFKADAELRVPAALDLDQLQTDLEGLAAGLMVDIRISH